jgi:FkbM family methyltransferase
MTLSTLVSKVLSRQWQYQLAHLVYSFSGARKCVGTYRRFRENRISRHLALEPYVTNAKGISLIVDPGDPRAWRLAVRGGATDPALGRLWQRLVTQLEPTVVVDVGANYGEVGLSCGYLSEAHLYLVEANPSIVSCLVETVSRHGPPNTYVVAAGASNVDGVAYLRISGDSGSTSLSQSPNDGSVIVPTVRLDSLLGPLDGERVLMKVDVEGHELFVLEGASAALESAASFVILCEYINLGREEIACLCQRFDAWFVNRGTLQLRPAPVAEAVRRAESLRPGPDLKDLLLARRGVPPPEASY